MRQILAVARKTRAFRVVEPFIFENRISDHGILSGELINYEAYASEGTTPETIFLTRSGSLYKVPVRVRSSVLRSVRFLKLNF
jgi:hypothetical protein